MQAGPAGLWQAQGARARFRGAFAQKQENCNNCEFYKAVRSEEGMVFLNTLVLLDKLKA